MAINFLKPDGTDVELATASENSKKQENFANLTEIKSNFDANSLLIIYYNGKAYKCTLNNLLDIVTVNEINATTVNCTNLNVTGTLKVGDASITYNSTTKNLSVNTELTATKVHNAVWNSK